MKAGVVIDDWKLAIFKKHLDAAGFQYTQHPGVTKDTILLQVTTEWVHTLQPVVMAANGECAAVGKGGSNAKRRADGP